MSSEATPIINPNVGEPKPDPSVIRHTHEHEHPTLPDAHREFPDNIHFHTHVPTYQHHTTDQCANQHDDFINKWKQSEYDRRRRIVTGSERPTSRQQQDGGDLRQPARGMADDPGSRGSIASTEAERGTGRNGAVSAHADFNAARYGYVAVPTSNTDPLDHRHSGTHTHPDLHGNGGTLTHPNHDRNDPGHNHAGYGPRIDPGAGDGALHSTTPTGYHLSARASEHSNRGADAKHATLTIRIIDDTPDTDTSQDRRRRETLERYPRKDGHEEGSEAS